MKENTLGEVLRRRRETLALTQRQLAVQLGVKASHIAYLEANRRRPSLGLVSRIAEVLGFEKEMLFVLAHPEARSLISTRRATAVPYGTDDVWHDFANDKELLVQHQVKPQELRILAQVNLLGKVTSPRQFLFILNSIRQAVEEG
jgi:transcriptional regulator with XRE-family HTH domain